MTPIDAIERLSEIIDNIAYSGALFDEEIDELSDIISCLEKAVKQ